MNKRYVTGIIFQTRNVCLLASLLRLRVPGPGSETKCALLGKKLVKRTGDKRSFELLKHRISIAISRGNACAIQETFPSAGGLQALAGGSRKAWISVSKFRTVRPLVMPTEESELFLVLA